MTELARARSVYPLLHRELDAPLAQAGYTRVPRKQALWERRWASGVLTALRFQCDKYGSSEWGSYFHGSLSYEGIDETLPTKGEFVTYWLDGGDRSGGALRAV